FCHFSFSGVSVGSFLFLETLNYSKRTLYIYLKWLRKSIKYTTHTHYIHTTHTHSPRTTKSQPLCHKNIHSPFPSFSLSPTHTNTPPHTPPLSLSFSLSLSLSHTHTHTQV